MVVIMQDIPAKRSRIISVPKERPDIIGNPGDEDIVFPDLTVPTNLNKRLLGKCNVGVRPSFTGLTKDEVQERIYQKNADTDLYMRFIKGKPISVVTDAFKEMNPRTLARQASRVLGTDPIVRYFPETERLQFNFPVSDRFPGLNIVVDTGNYGVYGGSGENAVKYGIAWFNDVCSNWTIFLDKFLNESFGRVIHRRGADIADKLGSMEVTAADLSGKIDASRDMFFDAGQLENYLSRYESRGLVKSISNQIREEGRAGISCYDLSYRLTELCQNPMLADSTRARIEYLAGEVILCYDRIMEDIEAPAFGAEGNGSARFREVLLAPLRYVSLN